MKRTWRFSRLFIASVVSVVALATLSQNPASATIGATVTFVQNDGAVPAVYASQVSTTGAPANLTMFSALAPQFSYLNHTFAYWSAQPGGGGTQYTDGATYSFASDLTLYAQWYGPSHTVTFYENNSASDQVDSEQVSNAPAPLTLIGSLTSFANPSVHFSNPNFTFLDWSANADGTGTSYLDGEYFDFRSAIQLFAQWTPEAETLSFSPNTGAGAATSLAASYGSTVMLPTGSTFSKTGNSFSGWNTESDGSGVQYQPGAELVVSSGGTLYAQWLLKNETLAFSPNTGLGSSNSLTTKYGSAVTLPSGNGLSKNGYSFVGWNTQPDASGIEYLPRADITVFVGETLYAKWSRDTYVITFSIPGVKGEIAPISVLAGSPIKLRSSSNLNNPGYKFSGWFTARVAGHRVGIGDSSYFPTASMMLYAQWKGNPFVGLEFSDNGGVGHIAALVSRSGLSVIVPSAAGLHRTGFTFRGWASSPRDTFPTVRIGAKIFLNNDRVIFALWRRTLPSSTPQVLLGSVGIFAKNSSTLTGAMRHLIAVIAIGINQRNRTRVVLYGYATLVDSANGSALVSLQRSLAVEKQLNLDLMGLNDVGVIVKAQGEGRLSNSVLASFRNVEIFAN